MKGEKKKKSVEKCKGADVKAIPENSIYLDRKIHLKFGFHDYSTNHANEKSGRKCRLIFSEDGRLIIFGQNCLNYVHSLYCTQLF